MSFVNIGSAFDGGQGSSALGDFQTCYQNGGLKTKSIILNTEMQMSRDIAKVLIKSKYVQQK